MTFTAKMIIDAADAIAGMVERVPGSDKGWMGYRFDRTVAAVRKSLGLDADSDALVKTTLMKSLVDQEAEIDPDSAHVLVVDEIDLCRMLRDLLDIEDGHDRDFAEGIRRMLTILDGAEEDLDDDLTSANVAACLASVACHIAENIRLAMTNAQLANPDGRWVQNFAAVESAMKMAKRAGWARCKRETRTSLSRMYAAQHVVGRQASGGRTANPALLLNAALSLWTEPSTDRPQGRTSRFEAFGQTMEIVTETGTDRSYVSIGPNNDRRLIHQYRTKALKAALTHMSEHHAGDTSAAA